MSGPQKGMHCPKCVKDFPGCLCNRCARDGTSADGTSCCAEIRKEYYCGEFDECPAFVPEDREERARIINLRAEGVNGYTGYAIRKGADVR